MSIYTDDWNIYMFMLRISICCFWNNQNRSERQRELLQLVLSLGFGDWRLVLIIRSSSGKKCFGFLQGLVAVVLGPLDLWYPSKCLFSTASGLFSLRFTQHGHISTVRSTPSNTTHRSSKPGCNSHFLEDVIIWAVHSIYKHT